MVKKNCRWCLFPEKDIRYILNNKKLRVFSLKSVRCHLCKKLMINYLSCICIKWVVPLCSVITWTWSHRVLSPENKIQSREKHWTNSLYSLPVSIRRLESVIIICRTKCWKYELHILSYLKKKEFPFHKNCSQTIHNYSCPLELTLTILHLKLQNVKKWTRIKRIVSFCNQTNCWGFDLLNIPHPKIKPAMQVYNCRTEQAE